MSNILLVALLILVLVVVVFVVPTAMSLGAIWLYVRVWPRLLSRMTLPVTDNRMLYWPLTFAVVWPLLFALLVALYQLFWVPFVSEYFSLIIGGWLAAVWLGSVVVACRQTIQWAAARQWRTVLSALILPLTFLPALLSLPIVWQESATAAPYVGFFLDYGSYRARVDKRSAAEPRFIVWTSGSYDASAVLYDETDEITSDHPSEAWKKKAKAEGVVCCKYRHIMGHFYWVEFDDPGSDVRQ